MKSREKIRSCLMILFFVLFGSNFVNAQLFQTREEVIKENGLDYNSGISEDGTDYISYERKMFTSRSGSFVQLKTIYFVNVDGKDYCYMWQLIEPSSEINSNVQYYKEKYVEIDYMQWKDFETNVVFDLAIMDEFCLTTCFFDLRD